MATQFKKYRSDQETIDSLNDGVFFQVLRKYSEKAKLDPHDVVIVSPVLGLLVGDQELPVHQPRPGTWRKMEIEHDELEKQRGKNLQFLRRKLSEEKYSEIYVNVGRHLTPLIAGFETFAPCKVVFAKRTGIGPKAQHMISWLLNRTELDPS